MLTSIINSCQSHEEVENGKGDTGLQSDCDNREGIKSGACRTRQLLKHILTWRQPTAVHAEGTL